MFYMILDKKYLIKNIIANSVINSLQRFTSQLHFEEYKK